ncbi:MAG: protein kinase [Planctomycetales bacterium]|nr:protein kinase [Planctomycetales bacterium]
MSDETALEPELLPSFEDAMAQLRRMPPLLWVNLSRDDQSRRYRSGCGVAAEKYLNALPEIKQNIEDTLVLICGEIQLRCECGHDADLAEYRVRFPELADDIALQFEINRSLESETFEQDERDESDMDAPEELRGYRIEEEIGRGSASIVYRARQMSPERTVAIKTLASNELHTGLRSRQLREAAILAKIQHPNVVRIYEAIENGGRLHLVMELIDGPTLAEQTGGRPLKPNDAAVLIRQLAEAMHEVHANGILHRDLKPSNILMTVSGNAIITDFGLAKWLCEDNSLTTENSLLGTPAYMAPEQALGGPATSAPTADVYSLGAIFYELLTGRPPFVAATLIEILTLVREQEPLPPRKLVPNLPRDLQTICLKCLEKSPTDRYTTANELASDLNRFLAGESILSRPPLPHEVAIRWMRRRPEWAVAITASFLLASVIAIGLWASNSKRREQTRSSFVDAIGTADIRVLPGLIAQANADSDLHNLPLETAYLASNSHSPRWLNLCLAMVGTGNTKYNEALAAYLPTSRPTEISAIVDFLLSSDNFNVPDSVWQELQDEKLDSERRLRLACLAARETIDIDRWKSLSPKIARTLVQQHPLDVGAFAAALRPVRQPMFYELVALARDPNLDSASRNTAVGVAAEYAVGQIRELAELIVDVDAVQFKLLLPVLREKVDEATDVLRDISTTTESFESFSLKRTEDSPSTIEKEFDVRQVRRCKALICLWHLGRPDDATAHLTYQGDPSLRSWLIELLCPFGIGVEEISNRIRMTDDWGVQQALVLALGQTNRFQTDDVDSRLLVTQIENLRRSTIDSGVHSACDWLLQQRLGYQPVDRLRGTADRDAERNWWLGPNSHTFAVVAAPGQITLGSPVHELLREEDEGQRPAVIDHDFAVSTTEVTVNQFLAFRNKSFNSRYSPSPQCPINNVTFFDAVAYCRWLSDEAGFPEDQKCYPPLDEIGPGMRLPPDWISRVGFRLPTQTEWEYACRAGVSSSRYFGEGQRLQSEYMWTVHNSEDESRPVGQLKPNAFGLFDTLGNVGEMCHPGRSSNDDATVQSARYIPRRGGDFGDTRGNVRASRRHNLPASAEWGNTGFRIVRTLPTRKNEAAREAEPR